MAIFLSPLISKREKNGAEGRETSQKTSVQGQKKRCLGGGGGGGVIMWLGGGGKKKKKKKKKKNQ